MHVYLKGSRVNEMKIQITLHGPTLQDNEII